MTPALETHVLPLLEARFSKGLRVHAGAAPFAVFPAVHPDVGDIEIFDDGAELTVVVGKFTHSHFANYDHGISDADRAARIAASLLDFLGELFADRIEMYGSHKSGGGTRHRERGARGFVSKAFFGTRTYVWSGPLDPDA